MSGSFHDGHEHPTRIAAHFGHAPSDLDAYLRDQMIRIVHRPARLRAMDRAILARDEVRARRRALRNEPLLFGRETRAVEDALAEWCLEWHMAIGAMHAAKKGRI